VFEQEDDERFVDFRPKQWSGFLVNEGYQRSDRRDPRPRSPEFENLLEIAVYFWLNNFKHKISRPL